MFQSIEPGYFCNLLSGVLVVCAMLAVAAFALGSSPGSASNRRVVIYARFSSKMQRDTSIDDQVRNTRIHLDKLGIPHDSALVLYDKEISGEREDRENYQKVRAMIRNGEVSILACDEISRFDRGAEAGVAAEEMEVFDCRFIAADGYDSEHDAHGFMATIKGKMAGMANRELAHRVRRGIAGRASDPKGADGSHPYGYSSRYVDPVAAKNYKGIGSKPFKEVFINEAEAGIVREIFEMYVNGRSLLGIARILNERGVPLGSKSNRYDKDGNKYQNGWHKVRISKLLAQRKFISDWKWGENIVRKTRTGKRNSRPSDPRDVIRSKRPELAIIPQELWDKAQERLERNRRKYGFKEGQKSRGKKNHYSDEYPTDLVGGLLFCGNCGARLHIIPEHDGQGPYYHCPVGVANGKHHGVAACGTRGRVHRERAIKALAAYLKEDLLHCEGWLKEVHDVAANEFLRLKEVTPDRMTALDFRLQEISSSIANITKAIESASNGSPDSLVKRLNELEMKKGEVERERRQLESQSNKGAELPSMEWIRGQLVDLAGVLMDDQAKAAILFRQYFGKVKAHIIVAPGKKRGHAELEFTPNRHRLVAGIAGVPVQEATNEESTTSGEVVTLILDGCDRLDKLMPTIDAMRQKGIAWKEISKTLKISKSWGNRYYNIWKGLTQTTESDMLVLTSDVS